MFDLQVNGLTIPEIGLHCDFWQAPADADIDQLCEYLGTEGVTGFYATLITAPYEIIDRNLARIAGHCKARSTEAMTSSTTNGSPRPFGARDDKAHLAGVHIEGGYISRSGIHPAEHLREFDLIKVRSLVEKYPGLIKLWTLCPLVDADGTVTKYLQSQGILVAYGHSNASALEADKAFDTYGVDLVTHWPNAMTVVRDPSQPERFDHRKPSAEYLEFLSMSCDQAKAWANDRGLELGLGFSAYHRSDVSVTAICGSEADGDLHMAPEIFKILRRQKLVYQALRQNYPEQGLRVRGNGVDEHVNEYAESERNAVMGDFATRLILTSDDVAYSDDELKAGRILGLRGGRVSLAKHYLNAAKL